jgi:hypothetical protein
MDRYYDTVRLEQQLAFFVHAARDTRDLARPAQVVYVAVAQGVVCTKLLEQRRQPRACAHERATLYFRQPREQQLLAREAALEATRAVCRSPNR